VVPKAPHQEGRIARSNDSKQDCLEPELGLGVLLPLTGGPSVVDAAAACGWVVYLHLRLRVVAKHKSVGEIQRQYVIMGLAWEPDKSHSRPFYIT
jgi:hypothetical protein